MSSSFNVLDAFEPKPPGYLDDGVGLASIVVDYVQCRCGPQHSEEVSVSLTDLDFVLIQTRVFEIKNCRDAFIVLLIVSVRIREPLSDQMTGVECRCFDGDFGSRTAIGFRRIREASNR